MTAARRYEARADLVRAAETVLETVRGGVRPPSHRIEVTPRPVRGLYEVRVEASAMVRSEEMVVSITTQVWRP